mmetsp:Transcript_19230/g.56018  ORF Transcript_19230/g.56018 Transcript_19230/m.56018 type:complete len:313 (+) Transcript_19230:322-1260(+)
MKERHGKTARCRGIGTLFVDDAIHLDDGTVWWRSSLLWPPPPPPPANHRSYDIHSLNTSRKTRNTRSDPGTPAARLLVYGSAESRRGDVNATKADRSDGSSMDSARTARDSVTFSAGKRNGTPAPDSCLADLSLKSEIIPDSSSKSPPSIRPLRTDSCSLISNTGRDGSVTATCSISMADVSMSSLMAYPAIPLRRDSTASLSARWGLLLGPPSSNPPPPRPPTANSPSKTTAVWTFSGLSNSRVAMRSPAANAAPSLTCQFTTPASSTLNGMNIFITSISPYGSPFRAWDPSGRSLLTSLPATSVRRLVGS